MAPAQPLSIPTDQSVVLRNVLERHFEDMKTKAKAVSAKTQGRRLIDKLPASASWDDVMQQIYVRQKIEAGLADLNAGCRHSRASIKREFGVA